jgi:hypothetical protein
VRWQNRLSLRHDGFAVLTPGFPCLPVQVVNRRPKFARLITFRSKIRLAAECSAPASADDFATEIAAPGPAHEWRSWIFIFLVSEFSVDPADPHHSVPRHSSDGIGLASVAIGGRGRGLAEGALSHRPKFPPRSSGSARPQSRRSPKIMSYHSESLGGGRPRRSFEGRGTHLSLRPFPTAHSRGDRKSRL